MGIWAYGHMGICEKIWSSEVSPKRASKMQLTDIDLRSTSLSCICEKIWSSEVSPKKTSKMQLRDVHLRGGTNNKER